MNTNATIRITRKPILSRDGYRMTLQITNGGFRTLITYASFAPTEPFGKRHHWEGALSWHHVRETYSVQQCEELVRSIVGRIGHAQVAPQYREAQEICLASESRAA